MREDAAGAGGSGCHVTGLGGRDSLPYLFICLFSDVVVNSLPRVVAGPLL